MTPPREPAGRSDAQASSGARQEPMMPPEAKEKILKRLKRLEGQVRGLQRMVEEGRACHDVLTLYSGIRSALDATAEVVLEQYVRECQADAASGDARVDDVVRAVRLARG